MLEHVSTSPRHHAIVAAKLQAQQQAHKEEVRNHHRLMGVNICHVHTYILKLESLVYSRVVTRIQACVRSYQGRQRHVLLRRSLVRLQAIVRGCNARRATATARATWRGVYSTKPFSHTKDMDPNELMRSTRAQFASTAPCLLQSLERLQHIELSPLAGLSGGEATLLEELDPGHASHASTKCTNDHNEEKKLYEQMGRVSRALGALLQ